MREHDSWTLKHAKRMRREMTNAELTLWTRLRRGGFHGKRFRRQHPIGPFIADFACIEDRLVIEVDGSIHASEEQAAYDWRRDEFLRAHGWRVLRFKNEDVQQRFSQVWRTMEAAAPPPAATRPPPPQAGEE